ncbi:MAG TPA: hypothetical protein VJ777_27065 [Mycobacterium sp.]|nr:hypothetical protein [Mycobacterium sp.]
MTSINSEATCQIAEPDKDEADIESLAVLMSCLDALAQQLAARSGTALAVAVRPADGVAALLTYEETRRALGYGPWDELP